jgi:hypothetical protein
MDLHEVDAELHQRIHTGASFVGRPRENVRDGNVAALEVGTGGDDARAHDAPLCDVVAQRGDGRPLAGHVAHSRDPVRHVEREDFASADDRRVDVHVPQPGDEELPASCHDARTGGNAS